MPRLAAAFLAVLVAKSSCHLGAVRSIAAGAVKSISITPEGGALLVAEEFEDATEQSAFDGHKVCLLAVPYAAWVSTTPNMPTAAWSSCGTVVW